MSDSEDRPVRREGVDAVDRALAILSAFGEDSRTLTLAQLARRTGLYKSMILRMAASLGTKGFLVRERDGSFRPGPELGRLGALYGSSYDLGEYVRPVLRRLVEDTRETASFYVRDGEERICLYRLNSPRPVRHHLEEGVRFPVDQGAAGRVLVAFSDPTATTHPQVRAAAMAISRGERDPEVAAAAAPVFDGGGRLRGALSISTLLTRFDADMEHRIVDALRSASVELSSSLPR